jgi:hypothetical protein
MESRAQLVDALREIEQWEREQKDLWFWEKLGRLPFVLLDKMTPKFLQEKLGQTLDEMMSYVETGGKYLISEKGLVERFAAETGRPDLTLEGIRELPVSTMDKVAAHVGEARSRFATLQGATTGFGGIFTLAVDIPMLLGLSLKVIQEIGYCYGYDPREKAERVFIIKCLQFTSCDVVGKKAILEQLAAFGSPQERSQLFAELQGWREVLLMQTENFGWKKLFQMIPVAGLLFGAYLNKKTIDDVAETARMLYRKRRVLERLASLYT